MNLELQKATYLSKKLHLPISKTLNILKEYPNSTLFGILNVDVNNTFEENKAMLSFEEKEIIYREILDYYSSKLKRLESQKSNLSHSLKFIEEQISNVKQKAKGI